MVIITDIAIRENSDGEEFIALILSGGLEMVRSNTTNKFYGTVRSCSVPSTLDEITAKAMIGQKIPGEIVKVSCEPYEFTTDSGETIELEFRYEYEDTSSNVEEHVFVSVQEEGN